MKNGGIGNACWKGGLGGGGFTEGLCLMNIVILGNLLISQFSDLESRHSVNYCNDFVFEKRRTTRSTKSLQR